MIEIDTGIILKIDQQTQQNNITFLTFNHGLINFRLDKIMIYPNKYQILDYRTLIFLPKKDLAFNCIPCAKIIDFSNIFRRKRAKDALIFNQIVINLYEKHFNAKLFNFLLALYQELSENNDLQKIYTFFLFHCLSFQGIQFNFSNCVNCNKEVNIELINFKEGGVLCHFCLIKTNKNLKVHFLSTISELTFLSYQDINK